MKKVIYTIEVEVGNTIIGVVKSHSRQAAYNQAKLMAEEFKKSHNVGIIKLPEENSEFQQMRNYDWDKLFE